MNLRRLLLWCIVFVPELLINPRIVAQTSKGSIVGVVRDEGAPSSQTLA